jgi:hypothetical protein
MSDEGSVSTALAVLKSALEPVPVAGCDVCGALGEQREGARQVGNAAKVERCNAEISGHPHRKKAVSK